MYETSIAQVTHELSAGKPKVFTSKTIALINALGASASTGSSGTTIPARL